MTDIRCSIARTLAALAAVVLTAAVAPTMGHAQTVEACYAPKTGSVYRINAEGTATQCSKGHAYFSWNVQGPQGPQGPQGVKGDKGDTGAQGPSGFTGLTRIESGLVSVQPGEVKNHFLDCPVGKMAISGGFSPSNQTHWLIPDDVVLLRSISTTDIDGEDRRWYFTVKNHESFALSVRFRTTCVDAS